MRYAKIRFSKDEIKSLAVSWLLVSAAFAIAINGLKSLYLVLPGSLLTVGLGFVLHEMGHKITAHYFGADAYYKSFNNMLLFGLIASFLGFLFLAPGAVIIRGRLSKRENGIISAMGPVMNLVLAAIFSVAALFFNWSVLKYGITVNSWLALFNMIPLGPFDGAKVWSWNRTIFILIIFSGLLLGSAVWFK